MNAFLSRAEEILDVALKGDGAADTAILIDRQGGLRMIEAVGWSLVGLTAEFGAAAVYRIQRSRTGIRVEGSDGSQRCLLERSCGSGVLNSLPMAPAIPYAVMLQLPRASAA